MGRECEFMNKFLGHSKKQLKVNMKCEVYTLRFMHTVDAGRIFAL